jgi:hypothetical protein
MGPTGFGGQNLLIATEGVRKFVQLLEAEFDTVSSSPSVPQA